MLLSFLGFVKYISRTCSERPSLNVRPNSCVDGAEFFYYDGYDGSICRCSDDLCNNKATHELETSKKLVKFEVIIQNKISSPCRKLPIIILSSKSRPMYISFSCNRPFKSTCYEGSRKFLTLKNHHKFSSENLVYVISMGLTRNYYGKKGV